MIVDQIDKKGDKMEKEGTRRKMGESRRQLPSRIGNACTQ